MKEVYERLGCEYVNEFDCFQKIGTVDRLQEEFGAIYSLTKLCLEHEIETKGIITLTRFEQFAEILETTVPKTFDFKKYLAPELKERKNDGVLFAPYSDGRNRAYSMVRETYQMLSTENFVEVIGLWGMPTLSYEEFIRRIYDAQVVLTVDTGVLHFALALGTPVVALMGGSDDWSIIWQYRRFGEVKCRVLRSKVHNSECQRPCNYRRELGFSVNDKCTKPGNYSDCLNEISEQDILETVNDFIEQLGEK